MVDPERCFFYAYIVIIYYIVFHASAQGAFNNSFFLHISCLPDTGDDGRPVFGRIALLKDKSGLVGEAAVSPMTTTSYGLK